MMKLYQTKKIIFSISAAAMVFVPFSAVDATTTSTNCNSITNSTLKQQCLDKKAQADAASAAAAEAAAEAQQVQTQVNSINNSIAQINSSISSTAGQISDTQDKISQLNSKIEQQEKNLADEEAKMNQLIAAWYMQGQSGLLETILSSKNVSDVADEQEKYNVVKEQIDASITKVRADRDSLNAQKNDQVAKKQQLDDLQSQQKANKAAVVSQQTQKTNLLNMTLAEQQKYLDQAAAAKKEISSISAQDAAERAARDRQSNAKITTGGSGGYPYGNPDGLDPWGFYQEQCTSYAAWYWNSHGNNWYNTQPGSGDAKNWSQIAATLGYETGSTPRVGAIISWKSLGSHGHVAIVERVNSDGSIDVSEYNWIAYSYSYRSGVQPAIYGSYVYIYP